MGSPRQSAQVDVDRAEEATQMLTSEEGASKEPIFFK